VTTHFGLTGRAIIVIAIAVFVLAVAPGTTAQDARDPIWWTKLPYPTPQIQAALLQNVQGMPASSFDPKLPPIPLDAWLFATLAPREDLRSPFVEWRVASWEGAVRFEVRLADTHAAAGLREARVAGSDQFVYLHKEIIVANDDISRSRVVAGDGPSHFGVAVEFNAAGAEKMRQATASHLGRPIAIVANGNVVAAPLLRGPISTSAVISGNYTRAEAERLAIGIRIR
jgi:hypothetical protein